MVNTFLPYADFIRSLARLDNKRIQKQSIEAFQIWMILTQPEIKTGFKNHPAVRMWIITPAYAGVIIRMNLGPTCWA